MAKPPPSLVPAVDLFARLRFHETGTFGSLYYRAWPVPAPAPQGVAVVYFYGPAEHVAATEAEPARVRLGVPTHVASADAETGLFEELRAVTRAEVGLDDSAPAWLGELRAEPDEPPEVVAARHTRLLELYDCLMPLYAGSVPAVPAEDRARAAELVLLAPRVFEPPLMPCYRHVGGAFFAWAAGLG